MKNKFLPLVALVAFCSIFLVSCSGGDAAGSVSVWESFKRVWILFVVAICCAGGGCAVDLQAKGAAVGLIARVTSLLTLLAMDIMLIAGFWRWEQPWWDTLLNLIVFSTLATCTLQSKGPKPIIALIFAIGAVVSCVFAYIMLW